MYPSYALADGLRKFMIVWSTIVGWTSVGLLDDAGGLHGTTCQAQENELPNPFDFLPDEGRDPRPPRQSEMPSPAPVAASAPVAALATPAEPVGDADSTERPAEAPAVTQPETPDQEAPESGVAEIEGIDQLGPAEMLAVEPPPPAAAAVQPKVDTVLTQDFSQAMLIEVEGPIFGRFHWFVNHRLDLARRQGVDLIIIRLTTPGGDLEYSLQLARRLRDIDWATTVVFVPEEAISGGAILSLGCDRIYMQRGALIGDAGPIRMGLGGQFEHAEEKVVSYLASAIRELATAKDRPAAIAEAMVDRQLVVYEATELATGETTYLTQKEVDDPPVAAKFKIGNPVAEAGKNRFLTLGAERAVELGLCEGVFDSEQQLLDELNIERLEPTRLNWVDKTVFALNRPWLTALLLIAGLIGLYLELAAPGISVAGLTSLFCFSIFFWSHALGGTAGWLEILLFFLGVTCLLCELFVLPGFGVFGISGIVFVVLSLVMASQDFVIPSNTAEWSQLRSNLLIVLGSVLGVMVLFFGQILLLDSIPGLNRFRLEAPSEGSEAASQPMTSLTQAGASLQVLAQVGDEGRAESDLRPSGKIKIGDRLFDVITEGDYVEAGSQVEVLRIEGNRIVVRKL
jgi:membrane-bound serine protease (ClpP class)